MLPFLKHKPVAGLIIKKRQPDEPTSEPEMSNDDAGLEAAANDLIKAVHSQDIKAVSAALKAAFELLDAMPHKEGPHIESEE